MPNTRKFTLDRIMDRVFIIVSKEQLNESGGMYRSLPITVYGFLKVEGTSLKKSHTSYSHISDDVSLSKELDSLSSEAIESVFPQND